MHYKLLLSPYALLMFAVSFIRYHIWCSAYFAAHQRNQVVGSGVCHSSSSSY